MPKPSKSRASPSTSKSTQKATHKSVSKSTLPSTNSQTTNSTSIQSQQTLLNLFKSFLSSDSERLLQEIKTHLYNRDFSAAFQSKAEYLPVYASRWSPSRALGYLQILRGDDVEDEILGCSSAAEGSGGEGDEAEDEDQGGDEEEKKAELKVVCLGGGAGAELAAVGSWWATRDEARANDRRTLKTVLVDVGEWSDVVEELRRRLVTPPEISKFASAAVREANRALLESHRLQAEFVRQDILEWGEKELQRVVGDADLVTVMFTLNELYSASMPKTQRLLGMLTRHMREGSLLLVVDSPGSYSTVPINGAEKKYPMQWLLDHTMLEPQSGFDETTKAWEKIVADGSKWFRLPQGLDYPIELENMRYQIHLYRRTASGS